MTHLGRERGRAGQYIRFHTAGRWRPCVVRTPDSLIISIRRRAGSVERRIIARWVSADLVLGDGIVQTEETRDGRQTDLAD